MVLGRTPVELVKVPVRNPTLCEYSVPLRLIGLLLLLTLPPLREEEEGGTDAALRKTSSESAEAVLLRNPSSRSVMEPRRAPRLRPPVMTRRSPG
jgi:hypothetical protein